MPAEFPKQASIISVSNGFRVRPGTRRNLSPRFRSPQYLQPIQFAETFRQQRDFKIALTTAPEKGSLPLADILPFAAA